MNYETALAHPVVADHTNRILRPRNSAGDDYFGLAPRTNGTAAECRRALLAPPGWRWERSSGRPPVGLCSMGTGRGGAFGPPVLVEVL
jgi:hypothetical protein